MPTANNSLIGRLSQTQEINLSVTGRKSGRRITNPVWFVVNENNLYLLPVHGSETQWYKNALSNPTIQIEAGGAKAEFKAMPISDRAEVASVVEKFRGKYGADSVKKYYSRFDVAVFAQTRDLRPAR
jgi:deazaflavin-dependent oxidoreductase (nitroreductase family)